MTRALLAGLAAAALLAGCGSSSSTSNAGSNEGTTEASKPPAQHQVNSLVAARGFRGCMARAGIHLGHISHVPGRVPLIQVPAEYVGAFANSNQVYDFWVAENHERAEGVAELLNEAMSERDGHPEHAAEPTDGIIVVAGNEGNEQPGTEADDRRIKAVTACEKATNRLAK